MAKKLAFFAPTIARFCKKLIKTFVSKKNKIFSPKIVENRRKLAKIADNWRKSPKTGENRRKLAKIAENCDHNIDPWSPCSLVRQEIVTQFGRRQVSSSLPIQVFCRAISCAGLPDGLFSIQNPQFWYILEGVMIRKV
jgi:hypothetical protein